MDHLTLFMPSSDTLVQRSRSSSSPVNSPEHIRLKQQVISNKFNGSWT